MTIHGELVIHTGKCSEKALEKAQKYLDQEVIRTCAPYVPLDTGTLERSGKMSSDIGSGTVTWNTPYAKNSTTKGTPKGCVEQSGLTVPRQTTQKTGRTAWQRY